MKRRLKVYFIHSMKMDYNNLYYKYLLSSSVCVNHELMLPGAKNYQNEYIKDLIAKADIIIAEVSDPNLALKVELKWLKKFNKPIKYISLSNTIPSSLVKLVPEIDVATPERPIITIIEEFISEYANMTKEEQEIPTIVLGDM